MRAASQASPSKSGVEPPHSKDWAHAPVHRLGEAGTYMVTAGTHGKVRFFDTPARLSLVRDRLFSVAEEFGWRLQAWAVLGNHYHFVAHSPEDATTLKKMLSKLHTLTARAVNADDAAPGRKVWFQYWDSQITHETSLLARLQYVHTNPVHHGVVREAEDYPWCSAGWLAREGSTAMRATLAGFKTDRVSVPDDF